MTKLDHYQKLVDRLIEWRRLHAEDTPEHVDFTVQHDRDRRIHRTIEQWRRTDRIGGVPSATATAEHETKQGGR